LFVIENNRYAYSTPVSEQFAAGTELWRRAAGYGIEGFALDATVDVAATTRTLAAGHRKNSRHLAADVDRSEHAAPARPRGLRYR
jgi:TPP-dependent pyruvate/acetoin dehydrogenase alpha subunit